jgi:hypothetical protein
MSKAYIGNPVFEFLQARGLSVIYALKITDIDAGAMYQTLEGVYPSVPHRVMRELVCLGADEAKLQTAYSKYRSNRRKEFLRSLAPLDEGQK